MKPGRVGRMYTLRWVSVVVSDSGTRDCHQLRKRPRTTATGFHSRAPVEPALPGHWGRPPGEERAEPERASPKVLRGGASITAAAQPPASPALARSGRVPRRS